MILYYSTFDRCNNGGCYNSTRSIICIQDAFDEGTIGVWAYNIETVLAEKVETILHRGELNTRPRDFYDIYILVNTQELDKVVFSKALERTVEHRNTSNIFNNI